MIAAGGSGNERQERKQSRLARLDRHGYADHILLLDHLSGQDVYAG